MEFDFHPGQQSHIFLFSRNSIFCRDETHACGDPIVPRDSLCRPQQTHHMRRFHRWTNNGNRGIVESEKQHVQLVRRRTNSRGVLFPHHIAIMRHHPPLPAGNHDHVTRRFRHVHDILLPRGDTSRTNRQSHQLPPFRQESRKRSDFPSHGNPRESYSRAFRSQLGGLLHSLQLFRRLVERSRHRFQHQSRDSSSRTHQRAKNTPFFRSRHQLRHHPRNALPQSECDSRASRGSPVLKRPTAGE